MEGAMPNTPGPGRGQKGNLCPGLEARHGRPHRCLPHHLGGDRGRPGPDHNRAAADPGHRGGGPDGGEDGAPGPHVPRGGQRLHSDFPQDDAQGVLGPQCLDCAPLLQELIRRELADCREYQTLSRRAGGGPPGAGGLAGEAPGQAARRPIFSHLRGALLAGGGEVPAGDFMYLGTLRRRFAQEQATMAAYLTGTETTTDPCLQQLFWEHAREAWDQACRSVPWWSRRKKPGPRGRTTVLPRPRFRADGCSRRCR